MEENKKNLDNTEWNEESIETKDADSFETRDKGELEEETLGESEIYEDEEFEEVLSPEEVIEEMMKSNKKISDENIKLQNEVEALKDKLLRISAEYDNFRKRTSKEKEGIYTDACEDVLKEILPVLDNLERAALVEGTVEDIKKGIDMTLKQFKTGLDKLQVEEIDTKGEFDYNLHNAVMHVEDDQVAANQIVEVFQKGYKRREKVLRHSMVKVAN